MSDWRPRGTSRAARQDLARFHIALDEGKLLKPESLQQMYTPNKLNEGRETIYGFGWVISKHDRGRTWIAHSGSATGGTTYLLRDPAHKLAVVILCNVECAQGLRALTINIANAGTMPSVAEVPPIGPES